MPQVMWMARFSACCWNQKSGLCGVEAPASLAHLDDAAAGLLQFGHLLPQGQRQLQGLGRTGQVLAGEGPEAQGSTGAVCG